MSSSVDDEVGSGSSSVSLIQSALPGHVVTFQQSVNIDEEEAPSFQVTERNHVTIETVQEPTEEDELIQYTEK